MSVIRRGISPSSAPGADGLLVPAYAGGHQDHDAANAAAVRFCERLTVWEFAAYNFAGGRVRANRFPTRRGGEIEIRATEDEAALKRWALAGYAAEGGSLGPAVIAREAFRPFPAHDCGSLPHPESCSASGFGGWRSDTRASIPRLRPKSTRPSQPGHRHQAASAKTR
jgi:hypothetical protein